MNELIARVRGMILAPGQEWRTIAREPVELVPLMTRYVMILAAIPAVAGLLRMLVFGFGFTFLVHAVWITVVTYVVGVLSVLLTAKIIEMLAPKFGGPQDADAALKLAAFAPTAHWVAGAAAIIPWIGGLVGFIGGLYALYTLYLGVPVVMRVPQEKALVFTAAVIGATILVMVVAMIVVGIII